MTPADHPSQYPTPHQDFTPVRPLEAAKRAYDEAPNLIAGIEFLLSMTGPLQEREIARAKRKEVR